MLQIFDSAGRWRDWVPITANGLNVGRARNNAEFPALSSMAIRHLRFSYERSDLRVQDLGSLNGVYLGIDQPIELDDGMRFRIGGQVIEFHRAEPPTPVPTLRSIDGEEFYSQDLNPLAYLDLIRSDNQSGLRFPITKPEGTIIGREGTGVDLALTMDPLVSGQHALIRHIDGKFFLEDMKSRNGTFLRISGVTALKTGDVLLVGRVLFRVINPLEG